MMTLTNGSINFAKTLLPRSMKALTRPENQAYITQNKGNLHLHAIQGAQGRYKLSYNAQGHPQVFDLRKCTYITCKIVITKNNQKNWRIKVNKKYRYFTQKDIDNSLIRSKIAETPIEVLQKRNNVEATVFQMGYHYRHNKSRYRGQVKHQMWASMRAVWVNFKRISKMLCELLKNQPVFARNWRLEIRQHITTPETVKILSKKSSILII